MLLCGVWEMHCNNLRLVLGLGLVRVSSRVRVSVMARVSIRTSWVANYALLRCHLPVIYTRPAGAANMAGAWFIHQLVRPVWPARVLYRPLRPAYGYGNEHCFFTLTS